LVNAHLRKGRGTMRKTKVFISSVIGGYEDRRGAAEEATIELNRDKGFNFEAIRTESNRHPAEDKSSQKVCLDGVKECDIYLGIFPKNNYGWDESPVGISPTHEEFRKARECGKQCLIFVENTKETDLKQDDFLKEVGDYVEGRYWNKFEFGELDKLKHLVYRALLKLTETKFEICLPTYLKSLLDEYERIDRPWAEDVDSLPVSEVVQLELREEEQKEEKKSLTKCSEIEKHSEVLSKSLMFADAIKEKPRLLIIGDPGAGKSTSLQWITYSYAEQILNHSQKELPVPIYLRLKWYNGSLLKLIATYFWENGVVCDEETINDWIKKEKFLFLLDGFDELDNSSKCLKNIKDLIGACSGESRFVVTSRKIEALKDFKSLKFESLEVKHLSNPQMELFTEKYLGKERGGRLSKELERYNLITEARNPLILWFMILEFQRDESQISTNKGLLFKSVIEHNFLKEWDEKVIPTKFDRQKYTDLKIEVLSKLAFFVIEENGTVKIEEGKAKEIIDDILKEGRTDYRNIRDEILRQLYKSHILIKVGTQVGFWHKSLRDYFAALELVEIFQRCPEEFVDRYVTERWEASILFFVGIMDDPSNFVNRLIQPFWRYFWKSQYQVMFRLSLAAKCIGTNDRISTETQQKVIWQLTKIIQIWESKNKPDLLKLLMLPIFYEVPKAFQALGETKSEKAADYLGEYLEKSNSNYYCQCAVNALRNVPLTEKAQNSLLYAALYHKDGIVSMDAIEILGENMSQETESKLLQVLNDRQEKTEVLINALYTLRGHRTLNHFIPLSTKKKYSDEVICSIVKLALESAGDLKSNAVCTLGFNRGKDTEERITNPLIHALLNNPNADIRTNAAYALFYHQTNPVRKALIQALDDRSVKVRRMAAHAFRYVGINTEEEENEASRKLLNLFSDNDNNVRRNAIDAYGHIRRNPIDAELFYLIKLLKDEEILIRSYAAEALGRLKAECAFNQLNEMVEIERYASPWASAIWAILQIEPNFIEDIKDNQWEDQYIRLLYDDDVDERTAAAEILEKIGTDKALPFLKEIASDPVESMGIGRLFPAIHKIEERIKRCDI